MFDNFIYFEVVYYNDNYENNFEKKIKWYLEFNIIYVLGLNSFIFYSLYMLMFVYVRFVIRKGWNKLVNKII